jgi:putative PEP-CTERM system histidine kinase
MSVEAFAIFSIYTGLAAFGALTLFFVVGLFKRITGRIGTMAAALTTLWLLGFLMLGDHPHVHVLENSAYFGWILLLARILGVSPRRMRDPTFRIQTVLTIVAAAVFVSTAIAILLFGLTYERSVMAFEIGERSMLSGLAISSKLCLTLLGLIMVEQVARNTRTDHFWNLKFIIIALSTIFLYGFVLYAEAMLFQAVSMTLLAPQGIIYAAAVPLIAIGSLRNRDNRLSLNVSRRFVFRTGSIVLAGSYLLIMSAAGYYVQIFGGEWADVFLVVLVSVGIVGLLLMAFSNTLRLRVRYALVTNLYEYRYDYREEWLRLNKELTQLSADDSLGVRAVRALAQTIDASTGAWWRVTDRGGQLVPCAQYRTRWNRPLSRAISTELLQFYEQSDWIIDLDEYRDHPNRYQGLSFDPDAFDIAGARLVVPLFVEDRLFGIAIVGNPNISRPLHWEEFDILKMIAQQVAGFLALKHLDEVLSESEQLRTMHQLSAFVVHDLKTVSAQMSLLLRNAERHKDKPGFVDDMIATVRNSAAKIERLLNQLRTPKQMADNTPVNLVEMVRQAMADQEQHRGKLRLETARSDIPVSADAQKLTSIIGHVIQNAQDAIADDGGVTVHVLADGEWATVQVVDDGQGMTEQFIANELFAPFVTTKGVAGIGIGAYQTREYIRSLGGDVEVESVLDVGTRFTLRIPLASVANKEPA